jgi:hypothetical protein
MGAIEFLAVRLGEKVEEVATAISGIDGKIGDLMLYYRGDK